MVEYSDVLIEIVERLDNITRAIKDLSNDMRDVGNEIDSNTKAVSDISYNLTQIDKSLEAVYNKMDN